MNDRKYPNGNGDERPPIVPRRAPLQMVRPEADEEIKHHLSLVVDNQVAIVTRLDQQNIDMVAIGLAVGRLETEHRREMGSVPDLVERAVEAHDTAQDAETWRWIKKNATKIVVGVLIAIGALIGAGWLGRLTGKG